MAQCDVTVVVDETIDQVIKVSDPAIDVAVSNPVATASVVNQQEQTVVETYSPTEKVVLNVGPRGSTGDAGADGDDGAKGDTGDTGDTGDAGSDFIIDEIGPASNRVAYDSEDKGFSYLEDDTHLIFIKISNTSGDWSEGQPFGIGPEGPEGPAGEYTGVKIWVGTVPPEAEPGDIYINASNTWS